MVRRKTSSSSCSCSGLNDVRLRRCDTDGVAAPFGGAGGPRPAGAGAAGPGPLPRKPVKAAGAPGSGSGPEEFAGSRAAAGLKGGKSVPPACTGRYDGNAALSPNWSWRDPAAAIALGPSTPQGGAWTPVKRAPGPREGAWGGGEIKATGAGRPVALRGASPPPAPPDAGGA